MNSGWQFSAVMIGFAPEVKLLIVRKRTVIDLMKTIWQAYDDFNLIATKEAERERPFLPQFASMCEVDQR